MSGFVEIFIFNQLNVAYVGKMDPLTTREFGKNFIDVIIRIFRNRPGAQRDAIRR